MDNDLYKYPHSNFLSLIPRQNTLSSFLLIFFSNLYIFFPIIFIFSVFLSNQIIQQFKSLFILFPFLFTLILLHFSLFYLILLPPFLFLIACINLNLSTKSTLSNPQKIMLLIPPFFLTCLLFIINNN